MNAKNLKKKKKKNHFGNSSHQKKKKKNYGSVWDPLILLKLKNL